MESYPSNRFVCEGGEEIGLLRRDKAFEEPSKILSSIDLGEWPTLVRNFVDLKNRVK